MTGTFWAVLGWRWVRPAAFASRTTAGYHCVNHTAATNALIVAAISIQSGIASIYSAAASAIVITAKAAPQTPVMRWLVARKSGEAQYSFGTRSRAYCKVNGAPMVKAQSNETAKAAARPASGETSRISMGSDPEHQGSTRRLAPVMSGIAPKATGFTQSAIKAW